jgi:hypothetical protein
MKYLDLTQQKRYPQSSVGVLGLAMVDDSALAIGIVSGDSGYGWPGNTVAIDGTPAGNLGRISGDC